MGKKFYLFKILFPSPWLLNGVSSLSTVGSSKIALIFCEVVSLLLWMHEYQIIEWVGRKLIAV